MKSNTYKLSFKNNTSLDKAVKLLRTNNFNPSIGHLCCIIKVRNAREFDIMEGICDLYDGQYS